MITVKLSDSISAEDLTWVRLIWGSLLIILIARPWRHSFTRSAPMTSAVLGVTIAGTTILYMVSITRLPLGTATALQFLGPLSLSVLRARGALKWMAVIPAAGVVALTEPWQGSIDLAGVVLALGSALFFAAYIVLTQRAGDKIAGLHSLAISVPVAAIVVTMTVGASAVTRVSTDMLVAGLGVAVLLPVIPYVLEFLALRRVTAAAFGTLVGLQPAVALVVGLVFLGQVPGVLPMVGIVLVVAASVGATLTGSRNGSGKIAIASGARCLRN
ncbi:EamA family transporter [Pseudarthrobacter sp. TAF60_1]|uniref:EamA family transporter n=1 Tax=Pseudarthrobacter sp. TAF60_1 TaxID=3233071 RepID=UPI003F956906